MSLHESTLAEVRLVGDDPFERGVTHGETLAEAIRNNIDTYYEWFEAKGLDQSKLLEHGASYLPLIENVNEAYATEMRGVAEGSDISIEEITMLNARYEAMYPALIEDAKRETQEREETTAESLYGGCSTFGVQPEVSATGHTYLGQNWDWLPDLVNVVLAIDREDGPNMVAMTEAGIVGGKCGVNEHGIGLGVNGLFTNDDGKQQGRKPFHVRCREVLDADRLDKAAVPITGTKRVCSANFLLGHADGEFLDLETAPEQINYLYPDDGYIGHSNHFRDRTGLDVTHEGGRTSTNTLFRANRIERLLRQRAGEIDVTHLKTVWRDHFNYPGGSVCRHVDEDIHWKDRVQTNCSFIIDLNEGRMLGALGPPCEHDYVEYSVPT